MTPDYDDLRSTFSRWLRGEPLSVPDLERWVWAFTNIEPQVSQPTPEVMNAIMTKLQEGLTARYGQQRK